ncbi:zinc finger protein 45-like isoform X1 [Lethenteron reissneri]|uniref:zinc finger protein 45-like isoform X1 n=1 Tax=Lethenteron reissneri TaxID=7753 RepID=UPI002AB62224|nr:zinc finger protein 45-like isoform X1 [Lethenteron reissneri]
MATAAVAAAVVSHINPRQDFPAWLAAHGVSLSVAEAVDRELGIGDYEAFLACAEQPHVRAEMFAAARERLPFAFYAVLRRLTEASSPKGHDGAGGGLQAAGNTAAFQPFLSGLLDAIVLMLNSLSQELLHSAERFSCLEPALYPVVSLDDGVASHLASDVAEVVGDVSGSEVNHRSPDPHSDIQQEHSLHHAWATNGDKVERLFQNNVEEKADLPQVGDCWSAIEESPCEVEETDVNVTWREVKAERDDVRDGETEATDEECFSVITRTTNQSAPTKLGYNGELHCVDHPHREDAAYYPYRRDTATAAESYDGQQVWQQHQQRLLAPPLDGHRCDSSEPGDGMDNAAPSGERRPDNSGGGSSAGRRDSPHSSTKPFGCRECGARFATKYNLRVHERRHTGERPFACEVCGRRFSRSYCLGRHKRCHVLRPLERVAATTATQPLRSLP